LKTADLSLFTSIVFRMKSSGMIWVNLNLGGVVLKIIF
jgi:hypothetical protein